MVDSSRPAAPRPFDKLTVIYFSSTELPSKSANSLQVIKMCGGLVHWVQKVTLVNFCTKRSRQENDSLPDFYSVPNSFDVKNVSMLRQSNWVSLILSIFFQIAPTYIHLRRTKPDLVLGRNLPSIWFSAIFGYQAVFETHYPIWESRLSRFIFNQLLASNQLNKIVVITEALKHEYLKHYPSLDPKQFIVLPDAADRVDVRKLSPKPLRGRRLSRRELNIGYAGSLHKGKGVELIVDLAKLLPRDQFHVFGGEEHQIDFYRRPESANIFFYGFVSQKLLDGFIQSLDICLLPIQTEMFGAPTKSRTKKNLTPYTSPMKLFQYMAHGKTIISSDLPVLREVLDESVARFAVPDEPESWATQIELLRDRQYRDQLGGQARQQQETKFTWERRALNLLRNIYPTR